MAIFALENDIQKIVHEDLLCDFRGYILFSNWFRDTNTFYCKTGSSINHKIIYMKNKLIGDFHDILILILKLIARSNKLHRKKEAEWDAREVYTEILS